MIQANQRWLAIRLDFMGGILISIVGIMSVSSVLFTCPVLKRVSLYRAVVGVNGASAAQIGLVLTYTVSITQVRPLPTI